MTEPQITHVLHDDYVGHVIDAGCSCGERLGFHSGDRQAVQGVILSAFGRHLEQVGLAPLLAPGDVMELTRRYIGFGHWFHEGTRVRVLGRTAYLAGTKQTQYRVLVKGNPTDPSTDVELPDVYDREMRRPT